MNRLGDLVSEELKSELRGMARQPSEAVGGKGTTSSRTPAPVHLIAPVGTRDLYFRLDEEGWQPLGSPPRMDDYSQKIADALGIRSNTVRDLSAAILARLEQPGEDDLRGRLSYPLLKAVLLPLVSSLENPGDADLHVWLVSTDQPEETLPHFRDSDTLHVAGCLACLARDDPDLGSCAIKWDVESLKIRFKPNDPDAAYEFFRNRLRELVPPDGRPSVIAATSAGIKDVSTALQNAVWYLYGADARIWVVEPLRGSPGEAAESRVRKARLDLYSRDAVRRNAALLIRDYNYPAAHEILKRNEHVAGAWPERLLQLLELGSARLRLDFDRAGTIAQELDFPEIRSDPWQQLVDVAQQAQICFEQGRYFDAVMRAGLLRENCRSLLAFWYLDRKEFWGQTEILKTQISKELVRRITADVRAKSYRLRNASGWSFRGPIPDLIFQHALQRVSGHHEDPAYSLFKNLSIRPDWERIGQNMRGIEFFERLLKLRNRAGHNPTALTRETLVQTLIPRKSRRGADLVYVQIRLRQLVNQLGKLLGEQTDFEPYTKFNEGILRELEKI